MAQGLSETDASTIISTIGATNTVGMVRNCYVHRYKYNICTLYIMQEKRHIQTKSNEISYLFISNDFFSLVLVVWTSLINVINHYTYWFI